MSDLEKFRKFFAEYGITFIGDQNDGHFCMSGERRQRCTIEGQRCTWKGM